MQDLCKLFNRSGLLIFFVFLVSSHLAEAKGGQETDPPATDWPELIGEEIIDGQIQIPLKRVGNLFLIEAQVDTLVGDFILDLGAPYLVLNATYFRNYTYDNKYLSGTMNATNHSVRRTKVKSLNIQGAAYKNLRADVCDLAEIENKRGVKVLGLLGVELFQGYVFDLDVHNLQLTLHQTYNPDAFETPMVFKTSIELNNHVIITYGKIGNIPLTFSLDTGSETNVLHNKLPNKVYKNMKILRTTQLVDGNGKRSETLLAVTDGIFIEGIQLKKMRSLILNLNMISRVYDSEIDGMLGYPFFASGRMVIDFQRWNLYLYQYKKLD